MNNFSIHLIWTKIQIAITALGGWLGYYLGGLDGLLIALLVFVVLDYLTGVMCAIADRDLSSAMPSKTMHCLISHRHQQELQLQYIQFSHHYL